MSKLLCNVYTTFSYRFTSPLEYLLCFEVVDFILLFVDGLCVRFGDNFVHR